MSKAEKRALEVYPKMSRITEPHGVIPADYKSHYIGDANEEKREGFIAGYHQAEKDLELTWEDIRDICRMWIESKTPFGVTGEALSIEVLNRFNKQKEK